MWLHFIITSFFGLSSERNQICFEKAVECQQVSQKKTAAEPQMLHLQK